MADTDVGAATIRSGSADDPERLSPGARAGEYEIEAHVGGGAMGDVYRARHPVIGKRVAIKVLKRKLAGSAEAIERFVREARTLSRIDHPNVVDVFALGQLDDGRLWLAMSYLEGESLGRRLRRDGPLAPEAACEILRSVCEALAAAHGQGVVHRDLKTDNIFLAKAGTGGETAPTGPGAPRVVVLDFGIAKVLADVAGSLAEGQLTAEGAWIGTPAYMAPEQWTSEAVTPRTDVYALGVVAYEMMTGKPPYTGSSLPALMEQHFRAEMPPMSTPTGGVRVPEAVEAVIRRALAKDPAKRPGSAMELLVELERALGLTGAGRGPGLAAPTVAGARGGAGRGGRAFALGGIAVGVGAAALALVLLLGGRRDRADAAAAGPVAAAGAEVFITSIPSRAEVWRDGRRIESTPYHFTGEPGEKAHLELRKLGYEDLVREVEIADGLELELELAKVDGFEGIWRIPGDKLRRFEHAGDVVRGYELEAIGGQEKFLRTFEFLRREDGGALVFGASEKNQEPRAPGEPSCAIDLATEYRWDAAAQKLAQRRERVEYVVRSGRCEPPPGKPLEKQWTEWEPVESLQRAAVPTVAESSAGAGNVDVVPQDVKKQAVKKPPAPAKKKAPPPAKKKAPPPAKDTKVAPPPQAGKQAPNVEPKAPPQKPLANEPAAQQVLPPTGSQQAPEPQLQQKKK